MKNFNFKNTANKNDNSINYAIEKFNNLKIDKDGSMLEVTESTEEWNSRYVFFISESNGKITIDRYTLSQEENKSWNENNFTSKGATISDDFVSENGLYEIKLVPMTWAEYEEWYEINKPSYGKPTEVAINEQ